MRGSKAEQGGEMVAEPPLPSHFLSCRTARPGAALAVMGAKRKLWVIFWVKLRLQGSSKHFSGCSRAHKLCSSTASSGESSSCGLGPLSEPKPSLKTPKVCGWHTPLLNFSESAAVF